MNEQPEQTLVFKNHRRYKYDHQKQMHYGIWSCTSKRFMFGVDEPSKSKAWAKLKKNLRLGSTGISSLGTFEVKEI